MNEAKPFCISKKEVWEAYKRVKANKGAAGVDDQSIEDFEKRLEEESLQDLESDVVGQLLSTTGTDGEDTKEKRWRKKTGHTDDDFIMHLPPIAFRNPSEFCLNCAPTRGVSVRPRC